MTEHVLSVSIEPLLGYPALLMSWQHQVQKPEMEAAFQAVHAALEEADRELYLVLDLTRNPQLEVMEVVAAALPVFRHPRLAKWLMIGQSGLGRVIESKLATLTRRDKMALWFATADEAYEYLRAVDVMHGSRSE